LSPQEKQRSIWREMKVMTNEVKPKNVKPEKDKPEKDKPVFGV
jgi:hypothetical protein